LTTWLRRHGRITPARKTPEQHARHDRHSSH